MFPKPRKTKIEKKRMNGNKIGNTFRKCKPFGNANSIKPCFSQKN